MARSQPDLPVSAASRRSVFFATLNWPPAALSSLRSALHLPYCPGPGKSVTMTKSVARSRSLQFLDDYGLSLHELPKTRHLLSYKRKETLALTKAYLQPLASADHAAFSSGKKAALRRQNSCNLCLDRLTSQT